MISIDLEDALIVLLYVISSAVFTLSVAPIAKITMFPCDCFETSFVSAETNLLSALLLFATSLASEPVFTAPLYEGDKASCAAGNTYGDCAVVEVDGALHIVAQMQGGGLSIFKLN